ncbi:MAG: hypothetical protein C4547_08095 [Phycisphaerales bacterium]|nr:MAG: hypothetical protein C4547_08095 [Phycisphaerales bacterium]
MNDLPTSSRWPGRLALATALLTFPLVFVGGGVTSKDAGMVYPTAPLSNDALINPPGWTERSETFLEHGHRLIGWSVGSAALLTAVTALVVEPRRWVRWLAIAALAAIAFQGSMGIWRVNHDSVRWAIVHGVWGQLCFATVASVALVTSRCWLDRAERVESPLALPLQLTAVVLAICLAVQLVLGVLTRQSAWGFEWHVLGAMVVTVLAGRVCFRVFADLPRSRALRRAAGGLLVLFCLQLTLGMAALAVTGGSSSHVKNPTLVEWVIPTLHVAAGALILATAVCTMLLAFRLVVSSADPSEARQGAEVAQT